MEIDMDWLLFLSQLPSNPSSLRVQVWRKMRTAGALGIQNGSWLLPATAENEQFMLDLLKRIQEQDANGQIFKVAPLNETIEADVIQRFQADRDQEYGELIERCTEFLGEIEKETQKQKFIFAELEEAEDDLAKLTRWQEKILKRDFAQAPKRDQADELMRKCRLALEQFSRAVYAREGLPEEDNPE